MNERYCLKCGVKVNIDFLKNKIFCTNCGNLIYKNDGNVGSIKFKRHDVINNQKIFIDCYINEIKNARLSNGQSKIIYLPFGTYDVYVKHSNNNKKSNIYSIKIDKNNKKNTIYVRQGNYSKPLTKLNADFTSKENAIYILIQLVYVIIVFLVFIIVFILHLI